MDFFYGLFWLYLFTATGIVTMWYVSGRLTPLIDIVLGIVGCAIDAILRLGAMGILDVVRFLETKILYPFVRILPITPLIIAEVFFLIGCAVLYWDHFEGIKLFMMDESVLFFTVKLYGQTFWITRAGAVVAGFFFLIPFLYVLNLLWKGLSMLLDHPVHISVTFTK